MASTPKTAVATVGDGPTPAFPFTPATPRARHDGWIASITPSLLRTLGTFERRQSGRLPSTNVGAAMPEAWRGPMSRTAISLG